MKSRAVHLALLSLAGLVKSTVMKTYRDATFDLARIHAAKAYVSSVKSARQTVIGAACGILGIAVFLTGFILLHIAVFMFAPWTAQTKLIAALSVGAVEFLIPVAVVAYFLSQKKWMRLSKADKVVSFALKREKPVKVCR